MKKCILFCMVIMCLQSVRAGAQDSYTERAKKYIDQYSTLAMEEQRKNGIPAAVTLGQGILETEAGASELMTIANNHFGIKCSNGWDGPTFSHTDDAPDECFKKYSCAAESYRDHSDHLKRNPRYAPLFSLSETDYAGWAVCLKKCGYATNPQYAQSLIKIIEDFKLQEFTYSALNNTVPVDYAAPAVSKTGIALKDEPTDTDDVGDADTVAITSKEQSIDPIRRIADSANNMVSHLQASAPPADKEVVTDASNNYENSKLITVNRLKAFYAYKGEMLLQYAVKFNVRYPKLLEINDLPDAPLAFNTYIYVEKKSAIGTHSEHAVKEGETMLAVSQIEGIQLKRLLALNLCQPGEEPATGDILELQFPARKKPLLRAAEVPFAKKDNTTAYASASQIVQNSTYTAPVNETNELKPVSTPIKKAALVTTITEQPIADTASEIEEDYEDSTITDKVDAATTTPVKSPVPVTATAIEKYYTVKRGDTAFSIAKRNNVNLDDLMKWNNITSDIQVGQVLQVKE